MPVVRTRYHLKHCVIIIAVLAICCACAQRWVGHLRTERMQRIEDSNHIWIMPWDDDAEIDSNVLKASEQIHKEMQR
jgi:hypothetical protein